MHICMFSVLTSNYFVSDMLGFCELKHFLQLSFILSHESSVAEYNSFVVTEEADTEIAMLLHSHEHTRSFISGYI